MSSTIVREMIPQIVVVIKSDPASGSGETVLENVNLAQMRGLTYHKKRNPAKCAGLRRV
jgi:hypothetical protein